MATTFKPIDGQEIAAGSAVTVHTSTGNNQIVTSFQVLAPVGYAGSGVVSVFRIPQGQSAGNQYLVASKTMNAEDRIDLKNLFLDNGDFIAVQTTVAGVVASGSFSELT